MLLYDKRGSGRSTGVLSTSDYDDLAADIAAGVTNRRLAPSVPSTTSRSPSVRPMACVGSKKGATVTASRLLTRAHVRSALKASVQRLEQKAIASAEERDVALSDIIRDPESSTMERIAAIKELNKVTGRHIVRVEGNLDVVHHTPESLMRLSDAELADEMEKTANETLAMSAEFRANQGPAPDRGHDVRGDLMTERSLQITSRKGQAFAGYLHLSHRTGERSARTVASDDGLLVVRLRFGRKTDWRRVHRAACDSARALESAPKGTWRGSVVGTRLSNGFFVWRDGRRRPAPRWQPDAPKTAPSPGPCHPRAKVVRLMPCSRRNDALHHLFKRRNGKHSFRYLSELSALLSMTIGNISGF